jgi:hypothetical protein
MESTGLEAREAELDEAFERTLLQSVRADALPPGATREAWLRFSGSVAAAAVLNGGGSVSRAAMTSGKAAAAKWLLIGAIGGSSLTAAWMRSMHGGSATTLRPNVAETRAAPVGQEPTARSATSPVAEVLHDEPSERETSERPRSAIPDRRPRERGHVVSGDADRAARVARDAAGGPPQSKGAGSTLAAQVALLDAARTASAVGATEDALRLVGEYHRDFPQGELTADADVVAIDVLAAGGDRSSARERAARFLAQHPNDPHATHVRNVAAAHDIGRSSSP